MPDFDDDLLIDPVDAPEPDEIEDDLDDDGADEPEPIDDHDDLDADPDAEPEQRQQQRQPGRAERRITELRKREKEAAAERDQLRVELEVLRRQSAQPAPSAAERAAYERAEQEQLMLMDPDQRTSYLLNKQSQQFSNEINRLRFETWDNGDRNTFQALASRNPAYAAVADEVEKVLAAERAAGRTGANRETVAHYLIGKRAVERASRAKGKQARQGQQRIAQQSSRAGGASSDVVAPNRRSPDSAASRAKRLENIKI